MSAPGSEHGSDHEHPGPVSRVLSWPLEALIRVYQVAISPLLPRSCRYYPSCSAYGLTAVRRFGPVVGPLLAAWRLLRCNPFTAGGVDHVPPRGRRGLPDWETHRRDQAQREERWARDAERGLTLPRTGRGETPHAHAEARQPQQAQRQGGEPDGEPPLMRDDGPAATSGSPIPPAVNPLREPFAGAGR